MADTIYSSAEIVEMLDGARPDRYTAGSIDWAADVVDVIAHSIPAAAARQRTAEQMVKAMEANATRRTNSFLRDVLRTGALPLDWDLLGAAPLSVGDERVCLRALTANDLRAFADHEEDVATKDYAARLDAVKGARLLADRLDANRCHTTTDLARVQAHA